MAGYQANDVFSASNGQEMVRSGRKPSTFTAPGCNPSQIIVRECNSYEDLTADTGSTSSLLDVPRRAPPSFGQTVRRSASTGDPGSGLPYFSNQKDNQQQRQMQGIALKAGDVMTATTNTETQGLPLQANIDDHQPLGWNRGHSAESRLRVRKEAWIHAEGTSSDESADQNVPPIKRPTSPIRKMITGLSRAVYQSAHWRSRTATRVQPMVQHIAKDEARLPVPEEKDQFDKGGGNIQVCNTEGATAMPPSLVQTNASTSNVFSSMASTRRGQQLVVDGTAQQMAPLVTIVGEPSNIAERLLSTECTSMLKENPIKLSESGLQHDDMALASFQSEAIADRRLAVCEELEATLNNVKINGSRLSLVELRKDLAVFQLRKAKSLSSL